MYEKKFTSTHVFKNVSELKVEDSPVKKYFGMPCMIRARHTDSNLSLFFCGEIRNEVKKPWSVDVHCEFRVVSGKGLARFAFDYTFETRNNAGYPFRTWEYILKNHVIDNTMTIECNVTIKSMTGIDRKRKLSFADPKENRTDVVLVLGEEKFNVSRVLLASFSKYFEVMFFGPFSEAKKPMIELEEVHPEDFQLLLEFLYGKLFVKTDTVDALLYLADRFDVEMIRTRCENFLLDTSEMDNKNKLRIADAFNLETVKNHLLKDVKTPEDIKDLVPTDPSELKQSTLAEIVKTLIAPL